MNRKRRQAEHSNHERWLVSYADFITLLFAFFVVLYASSQTDRRKMAQLSAAIQGGFQQLAAFTSDGAGHNSSLPSSEETNSLPGEKKATSLEAGSEIDLERLRKDLEDALHDEILRREIRMRLTPEGLVLSLPEVGFFKSGDAHLLADAIPKLARIAKVLNEHGFEIRVEGHTDSLPIHTLQFRSNWELSTARATEVVQLLVERYHLDPTRFVVAGYGPYRPVAGNDTEEGRGVNRRVDLVVIAHAVHLLSGVRATERPPSVAARRERGQITGVPHGL